MRSGVGAFWPRSLRLDLLEAFLPCAVLRAAELDGLFAAGFCAFTASENTPSPAARSSDEARCVASRSLMRMILNRAVKLLLTLCRNFARQIHRQHSVAILAAKHFKGDFVAGFQAGHRFMVVGNRIDGHTID